MAFIKLSTFINQNSGLFNSENPTKYPIKSYKPKYSTKYPIKSYKPKYSEGRGYGRGDKSGSWNSWNTTNWNTIPNKSHTTNNTKQEIYKWSKKEYKK